MTAGQAIPDAYGEEFEALGVDGVVAHLALNAGRELVREPDGADNQWFPDNPKAKMAQKWLPGARTRENRRKALQFWIPQGIAIFAAVVATVAVFAN